MLLEHAQNDGQGKEEVGVLLHHKEQPHGQEKGRDDIKPSYFCSFLHDLFAFSHETLAVFDDEDHQDGEQHGA